MENNTPGVKYWFWKVYINNFLRSPTGFRVTSQIFFLRNHLSVSLGFLHTGKMVNSLWSHCKIKQPKVFNQQGYKSLQNICGCFILISHFKDYNHLKSLAAWLSNREIKDLVFLSHEEDMCFFMWEKINILIEKAMDPYTVILQLSE